MNKIKTLIPLLKHAVLAIFSMIGLLLFMSGTSPVEKKVWFTLVPLLLIWLAVYNLLMCVRAMSAKFRESRVARSVAITLATSTVLLLVFSALGEIALFDMVLLLLLSILGVFYFERTWPN